MFDMLDQDGSGSLQPNEAKQALAAIDLSLRVGGEAEMDRLVSHPPSPPPATYLSFPYLVCRPSELSVSL